MSVRFICCVFELPCEKLVPKCIGEHEEDEEEQEDVAHGFHLVCL